MADRGGDRAPTGGRGGFNRGFGGGRGDRGRGGCPPSQFREQKWVPITKLGRVVKESKIQSLEKIYLHLLPIEEYQIIDTLDYIATDTDTTSPDSPPIAAGSTCAIDKIVLKVSLPKMSEVIDTSMTAVLKRTASTDTLAENSKRKDTTEKAERVLYPDVDPVNDPCVIPFLYGEKGMGILSSKVENHSQLKEKAKVVFVSLQNVVGNGGQLTTLAVQVKNLFESRAFIQMFADAYMKAPRLLFYVEIFSNQAKDQERLEILKKDTWLESILQETKTTAIISGALTIVLGFWSDNYFYLKLREAVIDAKRKNAKPIKDFVAKEDRIVNLNVSFNIEGLQWWSSGQASTQKEKITALASNLAGANSSSIPCPSGIDFNHRRSVYR